MELAFVVAAFIAAVALAVGGRHGAAIALIVAAVFGPSVIGEVANHDARIDVLFPVGGIVIAMLCLISQLPINEGQS